MHTLGCDAKRSRTLRAHLSWLTSRAVSPSDRKSAGLRRGVRAEHDSLGTVLRLVRSGEAITRPDLEHRSGIGRATIADRVATLMERSLLEEGAPAPSTGGRSPRQLRFRAEVGVVLIGYARTTTLGVAIADLSGRLLVEHHEPSDITAGPAKIVDRLGALFDWVLEEHQDGRPVWAITIALPSPVEQVPGEPFGTSVIHGLPGWDGFPVGPILAKRFGVPVWMDTDARLMALGEMRAGRAVGVGDLFFIKIGSGIAAGLCSGGQVHRGAQGAAGVDRAPRHWRRPGRALPLREVRMPGSSRGGSRDRPGRTPGRCDQSEWRSRRCTGGNGPDQRGRRRGRRPARRRSIHRYPDGAGRAIGGILATLIGASTTRHWSSWVVASLRPATSYWPPSGRRGFRRSLPLTTRDFRSSAPRLATRRRLLGAALMRRPTRSSNQTS